MAITDEIIAAEQKMASLDAASRSLLEQMPPSIRRLEANIMRVLESGFKAACDEHLRGVPLAVQSKSALSCISHPMFASEMAFGSGVVAAIVVLRRMEKEEVKETEASEEYHIVEDHVPCRCGNPLCRKAITAVREEDGQIEVDFLFNGEKAGNIHLDDDGAKELAEQLLDARGC